MKMAKGAVREALDALSRAPRPPPPNAPRRGWGAFVLVCPVLKCAAEKKTGRGGNSRRAVVVAVRAGPVVFGALSRARRPPPPNAPRSQAGVG
jgi:hypothetical protein